MTEGESAQLRLERELLSARELLSRLDQAVLGKGHTFQPQLFQELLSATLNTIGMSIATYATHMGISTPSAERWTSGASCPHVALHRPLYDWMRGQMEQHVRALRAR